MAYDSEIPLQLIREEMTLGTALEEEENMLLKLDYPQKRIDLLAHLLNHCDTLSAIVAHHLNIDPQLCKITDFDFWRHGSFNLCIPFIVDSIKHPPVVLRFPLLYKVGEFDFPGNADEKLRCEAATYIYLQQNCPDIPIPNLWGFGFSNGSAFTTRQNASFIRCWVYYLYDKLFSIFRHSAPSPFFKSDLHTNLGFGYLLMDYIQDGKMLSETFMTHKEDEKLRSNLFTDLSRILLSLGRIPQPKIGSFTINDRGVISLSNRPLTCQLHMLENDRVSTKIDRKTTYTSVASYVYDHLGYHDNRLLDQPNSMDGDEDGRNQMTALSLMRLTSPHFIHPDTRHGPFFLTFTDSHQSNIFVDEDWHITCLIDLEWACSLPSEMQQPPYWITGESIDGLHGEELANFVKVREEFMSIFEREEKLQTSSTPRTRMMQENWTTGSFWFFEALGTTRGLYNIFRRNIQPTFSKTFPSQEVSPYWRPDIDKIIHTKLNDRQAYRAQLVRRAIQSQQREVAVVERQKSDDDSSHEEKVMSYKRKSDDDQEA